jgi:hypothetical protein
VYNGKLKLFLENTNHQIFLHTVKPVYKGQSREPENVPFIYMDLLYRKAGLTVHVCFFMLNHLILRARYMVVNRDTLFFIYI